MLPRCTGNQLENMCCIRALLGLWGKHIRYMRRGDLARATIGPAVGLPLLFLLLFFFLELGKQIELVHDR